jgi:hypothetical protein
LRSRRTGIGQYRSGVAFGRFSRSIKRYGNRCGYSKRDSPPTLTVGRRADRLRDKSLNRKSHSYKPQRLSPQALLNADQKHCQQTDTGNFMSHPSTFPVA